MICTFRVINPRFMNQMTHISGDTADDDLFLASSFHCSTEIGIVPRIDLTTSADDCDIWIHLRDLWKERTIGAFSARKSVVWKSFREGDKKQSYLDPCWW